MPGRDVANLPRNFPDALAVVLAKLGIPTAAIEREGAASRDVVLAATDSRFLRGTLNDGASWLKFPATRSRGGGRRRHVHVAVRFTEQRARLQVPGGSRPGAVRVSRPV